MHHTWAVADGMPFVYHYHLTALDAFFKELQQVPPRVPAFDPSKSETYNWESNIRNLILVLEGESKEAVRHKPRPQAK
jgi:hypothetical protein